MNLSVKLLYGIMLFAALSGCSKFEESNEVLNDRLINDLFSKNEIEDLISIINFIDTEICVNVLDEHLSSSCYQKYFEKIYNQWKGEKGLHDLFINKSRQQNLLNKISESTKNKLWGQKKQTSEIRIPKDDIIVDSTYHYYNLYINNGIEFKELVNSLGNKHEIMDSLNSRVDQIGFYSPIQFMTDFVYKWKKIDANDVNLRLYIALNLLSINHDFTYRRNRNEIIHAEISKKFKERRKSNNPIISEDEDRLNLTR